MNTICYVLIAMIVSALAGLYYTYRAHRSGEIIPDICWFLVPAGFAMTTEVVFFYIIAFILLIQ